MDEFQYEAFRSDVNSGAFGGVWDVLNTEVFSIRLLQCTLPVLLISERHQVSLLGSVTVRSYLDHPMNSEVRCLNYALRYDSGTVRVLESDRQAGRAPTPFSERGLERRAAHL